jgi:hypothetical protein
MYDAHNIHCSTYFSTIGEVMRVFIAPSDVRMLGLDDRDRPHGPQVMEKSISAGEIGRGRAVISS